MSDDKILPKDSDSDHSLPGRLEESNSDYFETITESESKPKNRMTLVVAVSLVVSIGFFSYYFMNQNEIDSQIIQNTLNVDPEMKLANQYKIGKVGSEHAHAAILITIEDEQVNFGLPQFQLSSRYIHFEDNNPYLIHRHATDVPLKMLFASFGLEITSDCIALNDKYEIKNEKFCTDSKQSMMFYVNGEEYFEDITEYVINQNDKIMISFGDGKSTSKHLAYLESLEIYNIPKTPQYSNKDIII